MVQRIVYGNPREVMRLLGVDSGGKINTAYIERINLTIRNSLARFVRKSMNCSKILGRHTHALDFFQAWYNFIKPHKSLRLEVNQGRKRWMQRTPAMAEGLVDHIWTIKELMTSRVPFQRFEYTTDSPMIIEMSIYEKLLYDEGKVNDIIYLLAAKHDNYYNIYKIDLNETYKYLSYILKRFEGKENELKYLHSGYLIKLLSKISTYSNQIRPKYNDEIEAIIYKIKDYEPFS